MNNIDKVNLANFFSKYVPKGSKILDIGCGIGENLSFLKYNGFQNVIGVDISPQMVNKSNELNHVAYLVSELKENDFDVLLFSHVIEHVGYPGIVEFLEFYFKRAKMGAQVVIITPVLYNAFFNDVDHIRPYLPDGLMMLFSENNISRQYSSIYSLSLKDISFRRAPLMPYHIKIKYSKKYRDKLIWVFIFQTMKVLKAISFSLLSKVTGYIAIFELNTNNTKS